MKLWYFFRQIANGAWLSPVERLLREQEAGGSNPLAPTKNIFSQNLTYLLYCKQKPVNGGDRRAFVCTRGEQRGYNYDSSLSAMVWFDAQSFHFVIQGRRW